MGTGFSTGPGPGWTPDLPASTRYIGMSAKTPETDPMDADGPVDATDGATDGPHPLAIRARMATMAADRGPPSVRWIMADSSCSRKPWSEVRSAEPTTGQL